MIYGLVRLFVLSVLFVLLMLVLKKICHKTVKIIIVATMVILDIAIFAFPVENLFFSFNTPQDVLEYAGQGKVIGIAEGDESAALLTKEGSGDYSVFFALKDNGRYKIAGFNADDKVATANCDLLTITVYNIKGTDDYYISIWGVTSDEIEIYDSLNTAFVIYGEEFSDKKVISAIGVIDYNDKYCCYIDGEAIELR